jgi:hypothetical protein
MTGLATVVVDLRLEVGNGLLEGFEIQGRRRTGRAGTAIRRTGRGRGTGTIRLEVGTGLEASRLPSGVRTKLATIWSTALIVARIWTALVTGTSRGGNRRSSGARIGTSHERSFRAGRTGLHIGLTHKRTRVSARSLKWHSRKRSVRGRGRVEGHKVNDRAQTKKDWRGMQVLVSLEQFDQFASLVKKFSLDRDRKCRGIAFETIQDLTKKRETVDKRAFSHIEDVVDHGVREVVINEYGKVIEGGDVAEIKETQERWYIILLNVDPVKQQNMKHLVSMSSRTSSHQATEIFHDEKSTKQLPKRLVKSL